MQRFEYKVIPAPRRGEKAKGVRSTPDRFAVALTSLMNALGRDGWDYVRADALPCDERVGLTGSKTTFLNMLVFRRALRDLVAAPDEGIPAVRRLVGMPDTQAPQVPPLVWPVASGTAPALGAANSGVAAE